MRTSFFSSLLLMSLIASGVGAAEKNGANAGGKTPAFTVPSADSQPEAVKFSEAQMNRVQDWIREKVPECPSEISKAVAQQFLEELQSSSPDKFDSILSAGSTARDFESLLLRSVAAKASSPAQARVREEIARRRVAVVSSAAGLPVPKDLAGTVEKIRDTSSSQYRRLVEGRMDDDDLQLVLKKVSQAGVEKKETVVDKPKVLSASDIVAEFSRRNQTGSAVQRLQAYVLEGQLKTVSGEEEQLLVFHMRPNCFKLLIRTNGLTRYMLAGDGRRYWQYAKGNAPQIIPEQALGERRYLAEFADPLFVEEGFTFERLDDGVQDEKKVYRLNVGRSDGSSFIARIDPETFREVGSEKPDRSVVRYSDFREVGGVVYAFHEEITDANGRKGVFELKRLTPNFGLTTDFFEPPTRPELGYYELEAVMAPPAAPGMKIN